MVQYQFRSGGSPHIVLVMLLKNDTQPIGSICSEFDEPSDCSELSKCYVLISWSIPKQMKS